MFLEIEGRKSEKKKKNKISPHFLPVSHKNFGWEITGVIMCNLRAQATPRRRAQVVATPVSRLALGFDDCGRAVAATPSQRGRASKTSFILTTRVLVASLATPPDLAEESKPSPAQKVKKESPGESLGESPKVLADPPKRGKNESPGDSASQNSPFFFDSGDSFLTRFGGSARTFGDSSWRLFFDFLSLCQVGGGGRKASLQVMARNERGEEGVF